MADNETIEIGIRVQGQDALLSLEKLKRALKEIDASEAVSKTKTELRGLESMFHRVGLEGRTMLNIFGVGGALGALAGGGIVAGLVAAGRAIGDFGRTGLALHYTAQELGTTAEVLKKFEFAGRAAGMSAEEAASDTAGAFRKFQDLARLGGRSELFQALATQAGGSSGRELGEALYVEAQKGGDAAMNFLLKRLAKLREEGNQEGANLIQKIVGISGKGWASSGVVEFLKQFPAIAVVSQAEAQKYALGMAHLGLAMEDLQVTVGNKLTPAFTRLTESMAEAIENVDWNKIRSTAETTFRVIGAVAVEGTKVLQAYLWTLKAINPSPDDVLNRIQKRNNPPPSFDDRFGDWDSNKPMRFSGSSGGEADGLTRFDDRRSTDDLSDQMHDVTEEVRRLNDILRGGEGGTGTSGRGGAGGGAGGMGVPRGTGTMGSSIPGYGSPGGGGSASSGYAGLGKGGSGPGGTTTIEDVQRAIRGGGGGAAAQQSDAMAPAGTPTSAAGATEVVTSSTGVKFRVAAAHVENFRGFIKDYEAAGGKIGDGGGLSGRPGNASYHPLGRAIDVNQSSRNIISSGLPGGIKQEEELAKKWGLRAGSQFRNPDRGHYEVNSAEAARVARVEQGLEPDRPFAGAPAVQTKDGSGYKHTFYAPGASGSSGMEGPYATSRPNPNLGGARLPTTLDDVRKAREQGGDMPVSLAGDPRRYGQTHDLGTITYRGRDGNMYTLDKVTGYVHDTGGAFQGRMDKLDIAAIDGRGMNDRSADRQMAQNRMGGGSETTMGFTGGVAAGKDFGSGGRWGGPMAAGKRLGMARDEDAASDRDVMNGALVKSMAAQEMKGRASIDIDVGAHDKAVQERAERGLFSETRSKAAPQMPNSTGGEKGDNHSGAEDSGEE